MSATTQAPAAEEAKGGGRKKLVIVLVVLLAAAGAAYWFLLKPAPAGASEPKPEPGEVVALEAIQVNLADGHYLRLGLALQFSADVAHAPDGSQALDSAIEIYSGREISELSQPVKREKLKEDLMTELEHDYHGDVLDVFYTDFVTQ